MMLRLIPALDITFFFFVDFVHLDLVSMKEPWLLTQPTKEPLEFEWTTQNGGIVKWNLVPQGLLCPSKTWIYVILI